MAIPEGPFHFTGWIATQHRRHVPDNCRCRPDSLSQRLVDPHAGAVVTGTRILRNGCCRSNARNYRSQGPWNLVDFLGNAELGNTVTNEISDLVETNIQPIGEDVIMQLDTLDGVLRMWAWRDGEQPVEDVAPLIEEDFELHDGRPGLWVRSNDGPSSALFRWGAFSTEHMPVNMAVPLSDLIGDFSGDDILDVADIDLLTAQIVAEPSNHLRFDLSGDGTVDGADLSKWLTDAATHNGFGEPYMAGDSNLDGIVNSADLNSLALHWGDDIPSWSAGDLNADGSIGAGDLNLLAINWQQSIPLAATVRVPVPEPSALLLAVVGLPLVWRLPTRSCVGSRTKGTSRSYGPPCCWWRTGLVEDLFGSCVDEWQSEPT